MGRGRGLRLPALAPVRKPASESSPLIDRLLDMRPPGIAIIQPGAQSKTTVFALREGEGYLLFARRGLVPGLACGAVLDVGDECDACEPVPCPHTLASQALAADAAVREWVDQRAARFEWRSSGAFAGAVHMDTDEVVFAATLLDGNAGAFAKYEAAWRTYDANDLAEDGSPWYGVRSITRCGGCQRDGCGMHAIARGLLHDRIATLFPAKVHDPERLPLPSVDATTFVYPLQQALGNVSLSLQVEATRNRGGGLIMTLLVQNRLMLKRFLLRPRGKCPVCPEISGDETHQYPRCPHELLVAEFEERRNQIAGSTRGGRLRR